MPVPPKIHCWVERVTPHGNHVYSLDLILERFFVRYMPKQFLHIDLYPYDPSRYWPESRVFSIASSSRNREKLCSSYSVQGKFTARMEEELKTSKEVWLKLPFAR